MSANPRTISPLRQRMIEDMRLCKLSEKTRSGYIRAVGGSPPSCGGPRQRQRRRTCAANSCTWPTVASADPV
jgi:hypothetical protein